MRGFLPLFSPKNEKMETSQDARSGREDNLHSIISKIADETSSIPESDLDENDFIIVTTQHGSFKRKPGQGDHEEERKIAKDDLEPEVKFISDEIKPDIDTMAVQIFTDLPEDNPFQLAAAAQGDVLVHEQAQPVYQQLAMEDSHSNVTHALGDSLDHVQVTAGSPVPMPQVALGLIPTKVVSPPQPMSAEQVTLQFQKKLEELEQQVKVLQNRNLALEESYKKLSDLVEAQNHLLASGSPFIQRLTPTTPQEDSIDTTTRPEPAVTTPTTPTPKILLASGKSSLAGSQQPLRSGQQSYALPRRVSAKEVLNLWENGCDEFPPLKDWTPAQKLKQQSKISRWKKLVDIFKVDYHGDMNSFEESFSDARGEVLPVTTILSLYETQQTPAFLCKTKAELEESFTSSGDKTIQELDEESKKTVGKSVDSESEDVDDSEAHPESKSAADGCVTQPSTEVRYYLPRKVTPNDIVRLWEEGCEEFPPVSQWSRAQKIGQETKIFRWRKIVEIFNKDSNRNWEAFYGKYANDRGHLMAISSIIAKYDAENATSGPIFDIPEVRSRLSTVSDDLESSSVGEKSPTASASSLNGVDRVKLESQSLGEEKAHILPRKVTAKDIIRLWETGYGDLPPLHQWTPAQKAGQRSKFSRWTKIYDIYKYHCKGDLSLFESKFSDERGELYPVTTIVAMFDAWESPSSLSTPFSAGTSKPGPKTGEGSEGEVYQLPRKVTARDVVKLWEEGCELFPPVSKWQKIHKVGHETKLFRWKKIVDIFRKDCGGSWEKFEERFSNPKGELLPISAILSKYDLENEPPSYLPKGFSASSLASSSLAQKDELALQQLCSNHIEGEQLLDQDKEVASDSDMTEDEGASPRKGSEFILPKKVTALDVIYLWENGLGDMPPLCQWTPTQKASQRSKISRWNKIVDIFKYECGSDIRKFEEKYRDEKGELLPITNILNLHDAQDKS